MHSHYYSEKQDSEFRKTIISSKLRGNTLKFYTASGVFSRKKVDKGTELLANAAEIPSDAKILDLGAGYGAAGIAAAKAIPGSFVLLTDINERAVDLCIDNIRLNCLKNCEARKSNKFSRIPESFDVILLNPPQSSGKKLCFQLIAESHKHLVGGGSLQLVARHRKGGIELEKKMAEVFGNAVSISKSAGYRVYKSTKSLNIV